MPNSMKSTIVETLTIVICILIISTFSNMWITDLTVALGFIISYIAGYKIGCSESKNSGKINFLPESNPKFEDEQDEFQRYGA